MVADAISLRSSRFFSPFPRGTSSLSVINEYLALRGGPRGFAQSFPYIVLLRVLQKILILITTGLSPSMVRFSIRFVLQSDLLDGALQPHIAVVWA
jgi:hypothetical protein